MHAAQLTLLFSCRATVFSHYAETNCPGADAKLPTLCTGDGAPVADTQAAAQTGPYWSLMFEGVSVCVACLASLSVPDTLPPPSIQCRSRS